MRPSSLVLVPLAVGCGYSSYYPDLPEHLLETGAEPTWPEPVTEEIPCSAPEGLPLQLTIISTAGYPVSLATVTVDTCSELPYRTLLPGETIVENTTDNWVWTVRAESGELLAVFQVPSGASYWAQLVP